MKRLRSWLTHAFAVEKETDFDPDEDDRALIEVVCAEVVRRHMATPATLFLESTRPLNYIGSQTMTFFEPVMRTVLRNPRQVGAICEDSGASRVDRVPLPKNRSAGQGTRFQNEHQRR